MFLIKKVKYYIMETFINVNGEAVNEAFYENWLHKTNQSEFKLTKKYRKNVASSRLKSLE